MLLSRLFIQFNMTFVQLLASLFDANAVAYFLDHSVYDACCLLREFDIDLCSHRSL